MEEAHENELLQTGNFIHNYIKEDLEDTSKIHTRFPPEPNGYLHIGHAKSIVLNYGLAKHYGGLFNLRLDDTNPSKENVEYVESIKKDVAWLGCDYEDRLYFASDYFDKMYECAVKLIKDEKAFVCDLTLDEMKEKRGNFNKKGENSPYRERSVEENLALFEDMKNGKYKDGEKTLRAKIDMSAPNINMRDPVIYRIAHIHHHRTGDKWCIYPMYDFAHPLEDAFEGITHSICTLEFEDHKVLYNWFIDNLDFDIKPRQIECAKLNISKTIMGKRHLKKLVDDGVVDGWDDPRLCTIAGIKRRGYTPEAIRKFCTTVGVSKVDGIVDIAQLEHFIREDLKSSVNVVMAVLDPIKVVITNYEDEEEVLIIENNPENEDLGTREVMFSKELYIEREDFLEDAPKKFFRLSLNKEVRLKGAYFILCNEIIKDDNGNIIQLNCTYDKETKSGSGFTGRKVKGTIHWVSAKHSVKAKVNLYDNLLTESTENSEELVMNENSKVVMENAYIENSILNAEKMDRFQFIRNGYFVADEKHFSKDNLEFNRIVSLKSSFKPKS